MKVRNWISYRNKIHFRTNCLFFCRILLDYLNCRRVGFVLQMKLFLSQHIVFYEWNIMLWCKSITDLIDGWLDELNETEQRALAFCWNFSSWRTETRTTLVTYYDQPSWYSVCLVVLGRPHTNCVKTSIKTWDKRRSLASFVIQTRVRTPKYVDDMTSSSEEDILMYTWLKSRKRRKRKWIHDFNESCAQHGAYVLARDLLNDPVKFQSYYRMSPESYKELLQRVSQPSALF
jgi:hypothetical protein